MNNPLREHATVKSVFSGLEDHGIHTVFVYLDLDGAQQGFGGIVLDEPKHRQSFIADLCALFGVSDLKLIEGRECYAIRHSPLGLIQGLEVDGVRFMVDGWRRRNGIMPPSTTEATAASAYFIATIMIDTLGAMPIASVAGFGIYSEERPSSDNARWIMSAVIWKETGMTYADARNRLKTTIQSHWPTLIDSIRGWKD